MIWYAICAAVAVFVGFGVFYIREKRKDGEFDEVGLGGMISSAFIAIMLILAQMAK